MQHTYPATVERDGDQFLITFPDVPQALTGAEHHDDIEQQALDALVTALGEYARCGRASPSPSPVTQDQIAIRIPALMIAKLDLLSAMAQQKISGAELARRLEITDTAVRRILDFNHRSHIDQVEDALTAIGKILEIGIRAA